jgi:tRNA-binding EMAP/Myf-like protein
VLSQALKAHISPSTPQDIEGKLVVVLANLKSRNMAGVASHGMLLAASDASHEKVELLAGAVQVASSSPIA